MLTLITGLPGGGKTLYTLYTVNALAKRDNRPVWYHGINGLKLDWSPIPVYEQTIKGQAVQVPQWWLCPANAIVVIDEAQDCGFGVRARGDVPEWARKLEKHRHLGIDLYFITQDPSLIDSHDRRLAELHFHVMRTFGMHRAIVHEFRPVRDNVARSRAGSIQHHWRYPKEVFEWYVSAEVHTHKRRIPMLVWVLLALPPIIALMVWWVFARVVTKPSEPVAAEQSGKVAQVFGPVGQGAAAAPSKMTAAEYLSQHRPRVDGLAYTAPIYDQVTTPVVAPYPAAAVMSKSKGCLAYSQQGTRLDMPQELCRQIVERGFFVAWQQPQAAPVAPIRADTPSEAPGGSVATVIGGRPRLDMAPVSWPPE